MSSASLDEFGLLPSGQVPSNNAMQLTGRPVTRLAFSAPHPHSLLGWCRLSKVGSEIRRDILRAAGYQGRQAVGPFCHVPCKRRTGRASPSCSLRPALYGQEASDTVPQGPQVSAGVGWPGTEHALFSPSSCSAHIACPMFGDLLSSID